MTTPVLLLASDRAGARFDPSAVLEPVALLPEQLDPRVREDLGGSRALMLAVLEEAIQCLDGDATATAAGKRAREASRARQWVRTRDPSLLFSFESVCEILDIESEPLREALLVKLQHDEVRVRSSSHRVLRTSRRVGQKRTKRAVATRRPRSRGRIVLHHPFTAAASSPEVQQRMGHRPPPRGRGVRVKPIGFAEVL